MASRNLTQEAAAARRRAAESGHTGDEAVARSLLGHDDPDVRATALAALQRMGAASDDDVEAALRDEHATVRRRALAVAVAHPTIDLVPLLGDDAVDVVEQAAWA